MKKFHSVLRILRKHRIKIVIVVAILALMNSLLLVALIRRNDKGLSLGRSFFHRPAAEDTPDTDQVEALNMPDKIASTAISLAWPLGTQKKKYSYSKGKPTPEYKEALDKYYPDKSRWGKPSKAGASCDVFVGTVARASGYDPDMPRGLGNMKSGQWEHLDSSPLWQEIPYHYKESELRNGDIIIYKRYRKSEHICIYVVIDGEGYLAEASIKSTYGHLSKVTSKSKIFKSRDKRKCKVYRAMGDSGPLRELGENDVKKDVVR